LHQAAIQEEDIEELQIVLQLSVRDDDRVEGAQAGDVYPWLLKSSKS
jgi:hypothetical protein